MHDIEPYYRWISHYQAKEDEKSPFFGVVNNEFSFHNKVYNYYIHPQWDEFGSSTLYAKVIYADYDRAFSVIELIGEWNDCLHNDIMHLKRNVIDPMVKAGIHKYVVICEHVLNFHPDEDDYYAEWYEDVADELGFVCFVNLLPHVEQEMRQTYLDRYVNIGPAFDDFAWRKYRPGDLLLEVERRLHSQTKFIE